MPKPITGKWEDGSKAGEKDYYDLDKQDEMDSPVGKKVKVGKVHPTPPESIRKEPFTFEFEPTIEVMGPTNGVTLTEVEARAQVEFIYAQTRAEIEGVTQ